MRKPDLTYIGRRFGKLVITGYAGKGRWTCRCDCGNETAVRRASLTSDNSKSCGCSRGHTTHGASHTAEFNVWNMMRQRCNNPNHTNYALYGGRGIRVCDRWQGRDGFANFLADMSRRPTDKHKLERLDNDGHYEPSNCVWATQAQQMRNTSRTVLLTHDGETLPMKDWALRLGIKPSTLAYRVHAWGAERALTTPVQHRKKAKAPPK